MFINKIGQQHIDFGLNCQDYGVINDNTKMVCDGCSEGLHTEVGAKTFSHLINYGYGINQSFKKLIDIFGQSSSDVKNYLCFTILQVTELEDKFKVSFCGDGYIILEDKNGNITFQELSDGEYPKYFAYNYVDSKSLKYYKDGVEVCELFFDKEEYARIGVASDGLRFIVNASDELKDEFIDVLKSDKEVKVKRFINKYQALFKDDVTIAF